MYCQSQNENVCFTFTVLISPDIICNISFPNEVAEGSWSPNPFYRDGKNMQLVPVRSEQILDTGNTIEIITFFSYHLQLLKYFLCQAMLIISDDSYLHHFCAANCTANKGQR